MRSARSGSAAGAVFRRLSHRRISTARRNVSSPAASFELSKIGRAQSRRNRRRRKRLDARPPGAGSREHGVQPKSGLPAPCFLLPASLPRRDRARFNLLDGVAEFYKKRSFVPKSIGCWDLRLVNVCPQGARNALRGDWDRLSTFATAARRGGANLRLRTRFFWAGRRR
jgi:hypothetical protein